MIDETQQIINAYYDVNTGLKSAQKLYEHFNKKIKLKTIKDILQNVKNKQVKSTNEDKLYIPITTPQNSYSADLTFYTQYKKINSGYHILFTIINNNTKKAYVYALKNKTTKSIIEAFKNFLNQDSNIEQLQCDLGSEFKSKEFKKICNDNNIKLILFDASKNKNTLAIINRFHRTIRDKIDEYMTAYNTKKFIDVLDKLVDNYNNTVHSSTNMKPNEVNEKEENKIINNKIIDYIDAKQKINDEFEIGDNVRLLKNRKLFQKGQKETYSKIIYKITAKDNNKFIIENNNKIKSVLPYELKKVSVIQYENPYLKNNNIGIQKKILKNDKQIKTHQKKLNKENLDIDLIKQKKLDKLKKQLN